MFEEALPSAGEVRALANQLLAWADRLAARRASEDLSEECRHQLIVGLAYAVQQVRRARSRIFGSALLTGPAWDVLLDVFIKDANGRRVSLDQLSLGHDMALGAIAHAVHILALSGLVIRAGDPADPRTVWLSLSEDGKLKMTQLLLESSNFLDPRVEEAPPSLMAAL
jgi:DNA-binding MarR family transcriptional regulator